jgi:hypothetical protein
MENCDQNVKKSFIQTKRMGEEGENPTRNIMKRTRKKLKKIIKRIRNRGKKIMTRENERNIIREIKKIFLRKSGKG